MAPNDGFLLNTLKTVFRLSRVLLDQKCTLSGAITFLSVRSSQGNLNLFEITRASVLFSQEFQIQWNVLRSENCSYSSFHHIFESKKFRFPFSSRIRLTWGVKCEKLKFIRYALKIVPDWEDHLEIFSRPQVIENYRQHLLLRIDYSQKTVIGRP